MIQYWLFIGILVFVYAGFKRVQAKEKKRMNRYYGYSRRQENLKTVRRAA